MHGTILVFLGFNCWPFWNICKLFNTVANRSKRYGFWIYKYAFILVLFSATVVLIWSIYVPSGPASGGWTIYPPLSALPQSIPGSGTGMTLWLVAITLFIVGSLLGGLNYIVTILNLRTKGIV